MRGRRGEKADINFGKIDDNFHQEAFLNFELEKFYGWMSEVYNSGSLVMRGVACSLSFFLANLKTIFISQSINDFIIVKSIDHATQTNICWNMTFPESCSIIL